AIRARGAEDEADAELAAGGGQGAGDVVAVADEDERLAFQLAEGLLHGQQVAEGLAGMIVIGQAVDDWHRGEAGEVLDGLMPEGAQDDAVDILADGAGEIGQALAGAQARFLAGHEDAGAAELGHGGGEADARPQRRLFEDQGEHTSLQDWLIPPPRMQLLEPRRLPEQLRDLGARPIKQVNEMAW